MHGAGQRRTGSWGQQGEGEGEEEGEFMQCQVACVWMMMCRLQARRPSFCRSVVVGCKVCDQHALHSEMPAEL